MDVITEYNTESEKDPQLDKWIKEHTKDDAEYAFAWKFARFLLARGENVASIIATIAFLKTDANIQALRSK